MAKTEYGYISHFFLIILTQIPDINMLREEGLIWAREFRVSVHSCVALCAWTEGHGSGSVA